jgi:hypothetical protein
VADAPDRDRLFADIVEANRRRVLIALPVLGFVLIFMPRAGTEEERAYDTLGGMGVLTVFLAFLWWRSRARLKEVRDELDSCLRELAE